MSTISGVHHVTSIATNAKRAVEFYTGGLGLSLLAEEVGIAGPSTKELFFGNAVGTFATIFSVLVRPGTEKAVPGSGQVSNIVFTIPSGSHEFWRARFKADGIHVEGDAWSFGERYLCFTDPDGLPMALVESPDASEKALYKGIKPTVGRVRSIEMLVDSPDEITRFLRDSLGFERNEEDGPVIRFSTGPGRASISVDLVVSTSHGTGRRGHGAVERVAWSVGDLDALATLREKLVATGLDVTRILDRELFEVAYFVAPGSIGMGIATRNPTLAKRQRPNGTTSFPA